MVGSYCQHFDAAYFTRLSVDTGKAQAILVKIWIITGFSHCTDSDGIGLYHHGGTHRSDYAMDWQRPAKFKGRQKCEELLDKKRELTAVDEKSILTGLGKYCVVVYFRVMVIS